VICPHTGLYDLLLSAFFLFLVTAVPFTKFSILICYSLSSPAEALPCKPL